MKAVKRLVQTENIRMILKLRDAVGPKKRNLIERQSAKEEDRFGFWFDLAQRHIWDFNTLVEKQRVLIARMQTDGADTTLANESLEDFLIARNLFVDFSLRIARKIMIT